MLDLPWLGLGLGLDLLCFPAFVPCGGSLVELGRCNLASESMPQDLIVLVNAVSSIIVSTALMYM